MPSKLGTCRPSHSPARLPAVLQIYWPLLLQDANAWADYDDGDGGGGGFDGPRVIAVAELYRAGGRFRSEALALLGHTMYLASSWVARALVTAEEATLRRATEALLCISELQ